MASGRLARLLLLPIPCQVLVRSAGGGSWWEFVSQAFIGQTEATMLLLSDRALRATPRTATRGGPALQPRRGARVVTCPALLADSPPEPTAPLGSQASSSWMNGAACSTT